MRTRTRITGLISFSLLWATATLNAQVTVESNTILTPNEFVGCDVNSLVELQVRHDGNFPIDWYTAAIRRVTLSPTLLGQTVNGYTGLNLSGHLGIGSFAALPGTPPPLTMLHLDNGGTEVAGYRPWMRTGTSMSEASEWMYVGFKRESADRIDAVINWADNREIFGGGQFGPDALRMVFTSPPTTTSVSGSLNGLEIARLIPDVSGDEGYFGIGDYFNAGVNPTERLDVLDGSVRIRQLPTELEADNLTQYVVVDPTGVLGWRFLPNPVPGGGADCDWSIANAVNNFNMRTALGTAGGDCPGDISHVSIGTTGAQGKLTVLETATVPQLEHAVHVTMDGDDGDSNGIFVQVRPAAGASSDVMRGIEVTSRDGMELTYGIECNAEVSTQDVDTDMFGIFSRATVSGTLDEALGGRGTVLCTSNGSARQLYGLSGTTNNAGSLSNVQTMYGVHGRVTGPGATGYGVKGEVYSAGTGAAERFGVHGSVSANGGAADWQCGVYGFAPTQYDEDNFVGSWAGYFQGIVRVSGNAYVNGNVLVTSDENLKTNMEELTGSGERIASLTPLSYEFIPQEHPHMQLPPGRQNGLGAQNVREVFPELVEEVPVPAVYDSTGAEIAPAMSHLAVNYIGLIPVLISAVQEQQLQVATEQATNAALTERLADLETRLDEQALRMDQLEAALASCCANPTTGDTRLLTDPEGELDKAIEGDTRSLHIQPNPFTERTTLHYRLERAGRMQLLANSADGKALKVLQEASLEAGAYQFNWETGDLTPGVYYITLLLDGEPIVKKAVKVAR